MVAPDFDKLNGLLPAVIQDAQSGDVLMLGFMNKEAWENTLATGRATFFSRTRQTLWVKGKTSVRFPFRRKPVSLGGRNARMVPCTINVPVGVARAASKKKQAGPIIHNPR